MRKLFTACSLAIIILAISPLQTLAVRRLTNGNLQDSPELAEALQLSASVVKLYREGKYEQAAPLAKRALELREKALGKDDELVVAAVLNFAEVQYARGKFEDSKDFFERALHSYQRTLPSDEARVLKVRDRLARNYFALGHFNETERIFKEVLSIREKSGSENAAYAEALFNLAEFYQFQGQYQDAEPLYERLVEIRTRHPSDRESLKEALDRYACLLRKEKRVDDAQKVEAQIFPTSPGGHSPIIGGVVNGKAVNLVRPPYPAEARASRASGQVTVHIVIDENGDVIRACAISGEKPLLRASESAALNSKFTTTRLSGQPVRVTGMIIYNFIAQ